MKILNLILAASMVSPPAFAQSQQFLSNSISDSNFKSKISEYFYDKTGSEILHPVKLLGTVNRPGIYHVPKNTNLTTLLSIAGGPAPQADLSNILISNPKAESKKLDLRTTLESGQDVGIKSEDIVFIPEKKYMISPDSTNTIMVGATVLSLLLTAIVVFRPNR